MRTKRNPLDGITVVHQRHCSHPGGRCNCDPSYRVQVWDPRPRKLVRKTFRVKAEAVTWRNDVRVAVRNGTIRASTRKTVREAADALVAGMADGSMLDRSGHPYKPSTRRSYEQALRTYVLPELGAIALSELRDIDVQDFADRLRADGLGASTVLNKLDPLRVICRRAKQREEIAVDPTRGLELPTAKGKRDRVASPAEAGALIAALPEAERAMWATAFYAGLRRGELLALTWACVDFDAGVIRVEYGCDDVEGRIEVKSDAGRRRVPLTGTLRKVIAAHKLATGRSGDDLVFGTTATVPFSRTTMRRRAVKAWTDAGLCPLTPHEARHCCASYLIAAGLNMKQVSTYMGHADVRITFNVYGHLLPGDEAAAAAKIEALLSADTALA